MAAAPALSSHAELVLRRFGQLDRALQAKGFPATSPWWHDTIRRWYTTGKKAIVIRCGRRGGKSSTLCRLGVVEALYGEHKVPPGDIGVVAIVSARRNDALERLRTIAAILDALGVAYTTKGETIELTGKRVCFTVFTASISGVSGFTGIFLFLDEVAKWKDSDTGANPANEVIKSIRPTIATQPNARMVLSSSPMGRLDAHADAFDEGDTKLQTTAHAPTWVANPSITEDDTKALEPDLVVWLREYAAVPQAGSETSLLSDAQLVMRAEPEVRRCHRHTYFATMDPATRGNAWTFAITTLSDGRKRKVVFTREWVGTRNKPLRAGDVFKDMAEDLARYGLRHVYSDQWSEDTLRELASQHGVHLIVDPPWTSATKDDAYEELKTIVQDGLLELPPNVQVKEDLLGIRQKLTRNGITYILAESGPRHSDFAPTIAMGVKLAIVPPKRAREQLTEGELAQAQKSDFLKRREKERREKERNGKRPFQRAMSEVTQRVHTLGKVKRA